MSLKENLLKFTPRKEQTEVLEFIKQTKLQKPDSKFFLLNIPPGVGKSHLAMMISDYYLYNINAAAKIDIITDSKMLQDQYIKTYDCINDMRGKENYECSQYACSCKEGGEFNKLNKTDCDSCPYACARISFISGNLSLTNFHLYMIFAIYMKKILDSRKPNVLIVDECHQLDDIISDFVSIKITTKTIKKLKFTNDDEIIKKLKKITNIDEYVEFLTYLKDEISITIKDISGSLESSPLRNVTHDRRENKISNITGSKSNDLKMIKILSDLEQFGSKVKYFLEEYENNKDNWVMETKWNPKMKCNDFSLDPIWSYNYTNKYIFDRYDMVILMSGTILNKDLFCYLNGVDKDKAIYYSIDSPFDVKNRPIYYMPVGKMSYDKKNESFKSYVPVLHKILDKYKNKKGIIHTNSFELASWIRRDIQNERLMYHDSGNKGELLKQHFESDGDSVLVSPSMDIGLSFDDEQARFQIITKIPYPSLASQKNKMRLKTYPASYSYKTVCDLLQIFGRIVRNMNDYGDTIIIDSSFSDVMRYSSQYIPLWIQDAIVRIDSKQENLS